MRTPLTPKALSPDSVTPKALIPSAIAAVALALLTPGVRAVPATALVSTGASGAAGNRHSGSAAISADSRFVAFVSDASNLVGADANAATDVFVRDLQDGSVTLVSIAEAGPVGGAVEWDPPALSADGRFVAFSSAAGNLVNGDNNNALDVFVRDRESSITERISVAPGNADADGASFAPSMSADGRYVAFTSTAPNLGGGTGANVFVRDRQTETTRCASVAVGDGAADGSSGYPVLSANGRYLAFASGASNLVADDANETTDIFVRDLWTGETSLVSRASDGTPANDWSDFAPSISADGRYIAFRSEASNLVPGDGNGAADVYVRDTRMGVTIRASVSAAGTDGNDASWAPCLSADGRYLAFVSNATNLTVGDTNGVADVFVRDLLTGQTTVASVTPSGMPGDAWSGPFCAPALSGDGRFAAFESWAANLVTGDANGTGDVFARGPLFTRAFSTTDAAMALRIAGGLTEATTDQMTALNVETTEASLAVIDFADALRIARKAAGLEP